MRTFLWTILAFLFIGSVQTAVLVGSQVAQRQQLEQQVLELQLQELEQKQRTKLALQKALAEFAATNAEADRTCGNNQDCRDLLFIRKINENK